MASQPVLSPGDVPFALRLVAHPGEPYESLASALSTSTSSAHRAVARLEQAGLLIPGERRVNREALKEFLTHGVRYAFPAVRGPDTRGVPTAWSAPALEDALPRGPVIVWPSADGAVRGESLTPLSDRVPDVASRDPWLHEMLALIDAIRLGQTRDRRIAAELLEERLAGVAR